MPSALAPYWHDFWDAYGRIGLRYAATGHYARIDHEGPSPRLLRGLDPGKDQSYFLAQVPTEIFREVVFPLGWWEKPEVRRAAQELGIPMAEKKDSQEICFVPDGDRAFLFGDGAATREGDIVDLEGQVLGRHRVLSLPSSTRRRRPTRSASAASWGSTPGPSATTRRP